MDPPSDVSEQGYVVKDPFFDFPTPKLRWLNPETYDNNAFSLIPQSDTA